jgi:hypothetical protein
MRGGIAGRRAGNSHPAIAPKLFPEHRAEKWEPVFGQDDAATKAWSG